MTLNRDDLDAGQISIIKLLVSLSLQVSNGEARRSVEQGAVKINEQKLTDIHAQITPEDGDIVQVGKRKFVKIKLS
ncbi:Tyrosine--tRNA ligase [compost metagenome]